MFIKLTVRTIQPHPQPPQNWGNILHSPKQPWSPQRSWLISVEHAGFSKAVDSRTGSATKRKKTEQISASLMRNSPTDAPSNATRLYKLCIYELFFFFFFVLLDCGRSWNGIWRSKTQDFCTLRKKVPKVGLCIESPWVSLQLSYLKIIYLGTLVFENRAGHLMQLLCANWMQCLSIAVLATRIPIATNNP